MPRRTKYRLRRKKKYNTKRRRFRGGVRNGDLAATQVPQLNLTTVPRYIESLRHGYDVYDGRGPRHDHAPVSAVYVPPINLAPSSLPPVPPIDLPLPPVPHISASSAPPLSSRSRRHTHGHIPTPRGRTVREESGKLVYYEKSQPSARPLSTHSHIPTPRGRTVREESGKLVYIEES